MYRQTATTATMPMRPGSPTLTNPDMILPYGQDDYSTTPSALELSLAQPSSWSGGRLADLDFSISPAAQILSSVTPTTPIIYGNGTMLSDIGEVTEGEGTPGKPLRPSNARNVRPQDALLSSSPAIGFDAVLKRSKFGSHQRQVSVESTTTVTTEAQVAEMHFEDFDDGVSVDDSNFQGDDEESVAESYEPDSFVGQGGLATRERARTITVDHDAQTKDLLSRRAELILANAKKRLDNMEGNLSRARSSLYITPSSSMSSINSSSPLSRLTPSPSESGARIIPQLGMPPARHRQVGGHGLPSPTSPGHSRIFSENSLPSSLYSASYDLNPTGAVGRDTTSLSLPRHYQSSPLLRSPDGRPNDLEQLREDAGTPNFQTNLERVRPNTAEPYQHMLGDSRGLTRSASSLQMRDLTGKMRDLKGKISTLRDKAREDHMKRQSLQSLRTPSPFTAAEPWYVAASTHDVPANLDTNTVRNPWNGEPSISGDDTDETGERSGSTLSGGREPRASESRGAADMTAEIGQVAKASIQRHPPTIVEDEENYETAEERDPIAAGEFNDEDEYTEEMIHRGELQDYRSESEASQYHDSVATQISHEDREDAFDYEHFFLHSAMGTISPQRMHRRGSTDTYSSEGSVETVHGPADSRSVVDDNENESRTAKGHSRQKSVDSVSTFATFATATEGLAEEGSDRIDVEDYAVKDTFAKYSEDEYTSVTVTEPEFQFPATDVKPEMHPSTLRPSTPEDRSSTSSVLSTTTQQVDSATQTTPEKIISRSSSKRQSCERPYSRGNISTPERNFNRPGSVLRNGELQKTSMHRPSVSSFSSSTGSMRSFPLVNKPKTPSLASAPVSPIQAKEMTKEMVTEVAKEPTVEVVEHDPADRLSSAPEEPSDNAAAPSLNEVLTLTEKLKIEGTQESPVGMLQPDDQVLVERLVASLGKCLLSLQEGGSGTDGTMWRRRLDLARRVLEGEALRSAVSIEELRSRRTTGLVARTSRGI